MVGLLMGFTSCDEFFGDADPAPIFPSNVPTEPSSAAPAATVTTAPTATTGDIIAGSATALVTEGVADGGIMMYAATTTNTKPTATDGFDATVPTAATLAAGTYYVWYYAKADATHSDSEIAGPVTVIVNAAIVDLSLLTAAYEAQDYDILTGTTTYAISIAAGATLTLSDATINNSVTCLGDANIILKKETVNKITSSKTALLVGPAGTTLTIDGEGQLDAETNGYDKCGIGSGYGGESGNIVINGGTINAWGNYGAAIGAADAGGKIGDITINGGKVTAIALSYYGAGIGSGDSYNGGSTCGNITITGGEVTATGGKLAAGIGAGGLSQVYNSTCGNITITGGTVTATGGSSAAGIGTGNKNDKSTDTKCGNITISGGTVVATKGAGATYDVGPGVNGVVGTVSVTVTVKDASDNNATIYTAP